MRILLLKEYLFMGLWDNKHQFFIMILILGNIKDIKIMFSLDFYIM